MSWSPGPGAESVDLFQEAKFGEVLAAGDTCDKASKWPAGIAHSVLFAGPKGRGSDVAGGTETPECCER